MEPVTPPTDPEDWTDEQWISWLKSTDEQQLEETPSEVNALSKLTKTQPGQMLGQAMLGLASAIYGPHHDEILIVESRSSGSDDSDEFTISLDFESPEKSHITFQKTEED